MSIKEQDCPWYKRLAAWLKPDSQMAREVAWKSQLRALDEAVRAREFERLDGLLQEAEGLLESHLPSNELPPRWNLLGDLHQELSGSVSESERIYRRALVLSEASPGSQSANLALSLNNLGLLLLHQRRFDEALPVFERLLPIVETQFGSENPEVATCLENIAAALRGLHREEEARDRRNRAATMRRRRTGALGNGTDSMGPTVRVPVNWRGVCLGGFAAGLILLLGEMILNGILLGEEWSVMALQQGWDPVGWAGGLLVAALTLAFGPILVVLYAAFSSLTGPGRRTAGLAALAIWFPVFAYTCTWLAVIGVFPSGLMAVGIVWGLGECVLAALAGRWLYRRV
jgi:tetratricopeptide (TPR) repeat protein